MAQTTINAGAVTCDSVKGDSSALAFGRRSISMSDADYTASAADYSCLILECSGTLTATRNVILPLTDGAMKIVSNATGQSLVFKGASGTGVTVADTKHAAIYSNGTNWIRYSADA